METVSSKYKVLFICLGNICRSPAAQAIFEHYVREDGLQDRVQADSAGIYGGNSGNQPDRRMRTAALYRGFAVTHIARQVKAIDLLDFDLVIAMDDQNYEDLMHMAPSVEATHKIRRMADFSQPVVFHTFRTRTIWERKDSVMYWTFLKRPAATFWIRSKRHNSDKHSR